MRASPIRFTWSGEFAIGFQTVGDGPVDLVYVPGWATNLDWNWRWDHHARFLRRLASFARVILFDPRGWGVSDRFAPGRAANVDELAADIIAVLDSLNIASPALLACNEGGFAGIRTASAYPRRVSSLVLFQCSPVWVRTDDMPWESPAEASSETIESLRRSLMWDEWAREYVRASLPSHADDEQAIAWFAAATRLTEAPGSALSHIEALKGFDVRADLEAISAPTLVMHRTHLKAPGWRIESSRYLAERIPGATMTEVPGTDDFIWGGDWEPTVAEIERFLRGDVGRPEPETEVATVVFTDVVNSTGQAAMMGDRRWGELRERHDAAIRSELRRYHGEEVDTAGDGFLATFSMPRQAVRFALAAVDAVRSLGLEIRAGVHTGEIERDGDAVRGIAVHIGARVSSLARANEILVSQTVKDLVAGSGLSFEDAGEHELKGVPDRWRLFRVKA